MQTFIHKKEQIVRALKRANVGVGTTQQQKVDKRKIFVQLETKIRATLLTIEDAILKFYLDRGEHANYQYASKILGHVRIDAKQSTQLVKGSIYHKPTGKYVRFEQSKIEKRDPKTGKVISVTYVNIPNRRIMVPKVVYPTEIKGSLGRRLFAKMIKDAIAEPLKSVRVKKDRSMLLFINDLVDKIQDSYDQQNWRMQNISTNSKSFVVRNTDLKYKLETQTIAYTGFETAVKDIMKNSSFKFTVEEIKEILNVIVTAVDIIVTKTRPSFDRIRTIVMKSIQIVLFRSKGKSIQKNFKDEYQRYYDIMTSHKEDGQLHHTLHEIYLNVVLKRLEFDVYNISQQPVHQFARLSNFVYLYIHFISKDLNVMYYRDTFLDRWKEAHKGKKGEPFRKMIGKVTTHYETESAALNDEKVKLNVEIFELSENINLMKVENENWKTENRNSHEIIALINQIRNMVDPLEIKKLVDRYDFKKEAEEEEEEEVEDEGEDSDLEVGKEKKKKREKKRSLTVEERRILLNQSSNRQIELIELELKHSQLIEAKYKKPERDPKDGTIIFFGFQKNNKIIKNNTILLDVANSKRKQIVGRLKNLDFVIKAKFPTSLHNLGDSNPFKDQPDFYLTVFHTLDQSLRSFFAETLKKSTKMVELTDSAKKRLRNAEKERVKRTVELKQNELERRQQMGELIGSIPSIDPADPFNVPTNSKPTTSYIIQVNQQLNNSNIESTDLFKQVIGSMKDDDDQYSVYSENDTTSIYLGGGTESSVGENDTPSEYLGGGTESSVGENELDHSEIGTTNDLYDYSTPMKVLPQNLIKA